MSDITERLSSLSAVKRALLRQRLREGEGVPDAAEPIAIIGMGCRLPGGANSPETFWRNLVRGVDCIVPVPSDRWSNDGYCDPATATTDELGMRWGGFVNVAGHFDPGFFGISPKEATRMDPQQRMVLQVAWEALEDAGIPAESLRGSRSGVFLGVQSQSIDYYFLQLADIADVEFQTNTGGAHSIIANRLSYFLDLRGPSFTVDTACSSSLVALHVACQSLRTHETYLAFAGGTNLIAAPETSIAYTKLTFLAPDGRCKTFDARANGFVRGEGCGIVVLKRLSDARKDHDPVVAVIRGTAVNQDGNTNGLTAPNGLAQQAVIRSALASAGVEPSQIGFVETHGTGTSLGDPIEVEALASVLSSPSDSEQPCYLGAVKTNIGHLESAAGVAGVIKAALCLRHRLIPPNLHFKKLNPHISLDGTRLRVAVEGRTWDAPEGRTRLAGVSSFGFGGTNAHVVLEEASDEPAAEETPRQSPVEEMLTISARNSKALASVAGCYASFLEGGIGCSMSLQDIAYTACLRRSHLQARLCVVGRTHADWVEGLRRYQTHGMNLPRETGLPTVSAGETEGAPNVVFVFSGQGPQWYAMGRELFQLEPVYREAVENCAALLRPLVETSQSGAWDLLEELNAAEQDSRLGMTEIAQPAIFALQMGLFALWKHWGVEPCCIIGHSVGEVAASCASGILSLEDAVRVVYHRARLMQRATGQGEMAAVGLSVEQAIEEIRGYEDRLVVAAINAPSSVVLSGDAETLQGIVDKISAKGAFTRVLDVHYAFHSPVMQLYQAGLAEALEGISPRKPSIPIVSTVTGRLAAPDDYGPGYWAKNIREPVRFYDAIRAAIDLGGQAFLEIGPHPVLATSISQSLGGGKKALVFSSLRRNFPDRGAMLTAMGALHAAGYSVQWSRLFSQNARCVSLPHYPWQNNRFWINTGTHGGQISRHPITSARINPEVEVRLEDQADPRSLIADVRVRDAAGQILAQTLGTRLDVLDPTAMAQAVREAPPAGRYRVEWIEKPRDASIDGGAWKGVSEVSPAQLLQGLEVELADLQAHPDYRDYEKLGPELRALSLEYIYRAFDELEWRPSAGDLVSLENVRRLLGVPERHRYLLREMLFILESEGTLRLKGDGWEVCGDLKSQHPRDGDLREQHPAYDELLNTFGRCGNNLAQVLRGAQDPLQVLFPGGSLESAEKFYRDLPIYSVWNRLIRSIFRRLTACLPKGHKLRILEIGAGTGGTTSYVAPALDPHRTEYVFTDLSKWFLVDAKRRFREFPFIRYELFDAEKDPTEQGFEKGTFDIVLAANVLHATRNLRDTLTNVLSLLSPEGLLLQLEVTGRVPWNDLLFGMTEGWWRFEDYNLRPTHALLPPQAWLELFREVGFVEAAALPDHAGNGDATFSQTILLARGPSAALGIQEPQKASGEPKDTGWLVFADHGGVATAICERIRTRGDVCAMVEHGCGPLTETEPGHFELAVDSAKQYGELLEDLRLRGDMRAWNVIYCWGLDVSDPSAGTATPLGELRKLVCDGPLWLARELQARHGETRFRLWFVTAGSQPVGPVAPRCLQAPLWGLGRTLAFELPDIWGGLVDLDQLTDSPLLVNSLLEEVLHPDHEDQVVYRNGTRFVPRLSVLDATESQLAGSLCAYDGAYMVAGSIDGLGTLVARWLVEQGARHLVVVGNREVQSNSERSSNGIRAIENLGATIRIVEGDASDPELMANVVSGFGRDMPNLRGVVYAPESVEPIAATEIEEADLVRTFRERVDGAWLLHILTRSARLDFFVLFSSAAAIMGSRDLAHFAASNHFMDILAHARRAQGWPALSVNWGWWPEGGTAESLDAYYPRIGLSPLSAQEAWQELGRLLRMGIVQAAVMSVDWKTFIPICEVKGPVPLLERIRQESTAPEKKTQATGTDFRRTWGETPPEERWDMLVGHIKDHLSCVLGFEDAGEVDLKEGFFNMGMDSITTLQFTERLSRSLGESFPATLLFEYPNIESLCKHLSESVLGGSISDAELAESSVGEELSPPHEAQDPYGELSEEDLVDLLEQKLKSLGD